VIVERMIEQTIMWIIVNGMAARKKQHTQKETKNNLNHNNPLVIKRWHHSTVLKCNQPLKSNN